VTQRGVGLLEAAVWLVVLLPVCAVAVSVAAVVHDQSHISGVPAAVLRESAVAGLRWIPDGWGGRFEPNVPGLRAHVTQIARQAVAETRQGLLKADSVSAKACFWIFSVDSSTGSLESSIWSECDSRGPLGNRLSLTEDLEFERAKARGIPNGESGAFVERVVVTGVVVAAETSALLDPRGSFQVSKGAIAFARQEVEL